MATFIVPLKPGNAAYSFDVDLDEDLFTLKFQFNDREGFYYFDLLDANGDVVRGSIKAVTGIPFLLRTTGPNRPDGDLLILDTTGNDTDPTIDSLGDIHVMTYEGET